MVGRSGSNTDTTNPQRSISKPNAPKTRVDSPGGKPKGKPSNPQRHATNANMSGADPRSGRGKIGSTKTRN